MRCGTNTLSLCINYAWLKEQCWLGSMHAAHSYISYNVMFLYSFGMLVNNFYEEPHIDLVICSWTHSTESYYVVCMRLETSGLYSKDISLWAQDHILYDHSFWPSLHWATIAHRYILHVYLVVSKYWQHKGEKWVGCITTISTILYYTVHTGWILKFSLKEICRKYSRIEPNFFQCTGNLALSYSISYIFPKAETSFFT